MSSKVYDIIKDITCKDILINYGSGTIFKVLKVYDNDKGDSAIGKVFVINQENTSDIWATSFDNGQAIKNEVALLTVEILRYGPKNI
jgi:hypothetical protein